MIARRPLLSSLLLGAALVACSTPRTRLEPTEKPPVAAPARTRETIDILYTSDEHGWVAVAEEKGRTRGGAAELVALWKNREGHCIPTPNDDCRSSATLALSGGDNWTGPAISSYFHGIVAAEAMHDLGYAASALGNHELDFGQEVFKKNAADEGFPYLAANVSGDAIAKPFAIFERRGVKVGVVGLALEETPKVGLRDHYTGLSFGDETKALEKAVPDAYAAGADVVVVIAHVCAPTLAKAVEKHPEWHLAFVGGGHCHKQSFARIGDTPVVEAGSFLREYVRAAIVVDLARPRGDRFVRADVSMVDLTWPDGSPPPVPPDPAITKLVATWQEKTDAALGEVIGYTNETFDADSPPLVNFITDRWREATGADVAILNRYGTRQAMKSGPIRIETLYSILPFDNHLVTVHVTGDELVRDVSCCHGHVSGVREQNGKLVLASGAPIDPKKTYSIVSTDYSYYGGSDFPFEKQDPKGTFGGDWREPLVTWLRAHPTSAAKGLETLVDHEPRTKGDRPTAASAKPR